jgi:hypothetical protein
LSTDGSEVHAASIFALMMGAARTSETSVDNYFTRQYIPEDKSELQKYHCYGYPHEMLLCRRGKATLLTATRTMKRTPVFTFSSQLGVVF